MSILNYLFIGVIWTFLVDILLYVCSGHPKVIKAALLWDWSQRFWCILLWPLTITYFLYVLIKNSIK